MDTGPDGAPALKPASVALQAAIRAGNINIGGGAGVTIMDLNASSVEEQDKHAMLLKRVEAERRARAIVVPTNKDAVRAELRSLGQPVRLFGENLADIRERLRELRARIEIEGEEVALAGGALAATASAAEAPAAAVPAEKAKDVYTEAGAELLAARGEIFAFSTARAADRLAGVKRRRESEAAAAEADGACREAYEAMRRLVVSGSQLGDERPLACVRCSPAGPAGTARVVATGSLASAVKLWDADTLEPLGGLGGPGGPGSGHTERSTGLDWHPGAFSGSGPPLIATASADGTAKIWRVTARDEHATPEGGGGGSLQGTAAGSCVMTLEGHKHRLGMVGFHPSGEYVGTASFDRTWRLWHVETGKEVLLQDGHLKEVYFLSFQRDGALVASGDLAGVGNVWDLRAGKKVMAMTGHVRRIVSGDFSPNGFQVATGGDDHTVRLWDMRQRCCSYTLPAHSSLISEARFDASGEMLLTCSFDGRARVWGTRDWRLLADLAGHEGKIMAGDWAPRAAAGGKHGIWTAGFDRTLKQWTEF